jgi:hypothetical protein
MTLLHLDPRSQLALLFAASVTASVGTIGCDRDVPAPSWDAGDEAAVYDPMPIDAQADTPVYDPLPGALPFATDPPPLMRMLPAERDVAAAQARAARDDLPLARDLTVRIQRQAQEGGAVRLRARPSYPSPRLSYVWMASHGTLSDESAGEVTWTPPAERGRFLIQVTVRDGERALAVDAVIEVR